MQRNETIDIAKGIGIILVVLGHLSSPMYEVDWLDCVRGFVYQYHIPLFFFLSGFFMKMGEPWGVFLRKKVTRLYLPYVISNLVFLAVYAFAHARNGDEIVVLDTVKHAVKVLLGMAVTPLGGATWFLFVLFISQILYRISGQLFSRIGGKYMGLAMVSLGVLSMLFHPEFCVSKALVAMLFLYFGQLVQGEKFKTILHELTPYKVVFFIISVVATLVCAQVNNVDMSQGEYGNPLLFLMSSAAGFLMTIYASELISKTSHCKRFLSCLGTSTMWVLVLHFFAFRIISLLQIAIYGDKFGAIFYHPCNRISGLWPLIYASFGILFPLLLRTVIKKKNA